LYDAASDAWRAPDFRRTGETLEIDLDIPPYGLWCLRASRQPVKAASLPVVRSAATLSLAWTAAQAKDDTAQAFATASPLPALTDWRRWPGLASYAGTVRYRAKFTLEKPAPYLALDLGRVEEIAELTLNGKSHGVRLSPPYVFDVTAAAKPGDNEITIDVTNTAYARWRDNFSHGDAASGLFGPVRLLRGDLAAAPR
jgi:hypothetical protein